MKLTLTVCTVVGLIVLVVVAAKFPGPQPVADNKEVLRHTDDDRDKLAEIRWETNPNVILDSNAQAVKTPSPVTESSQRQSESLDYIAGFQAGKEAGLRAAKEAELQAARVRYQELENSEYNLYDMDTLRSLAGGMDRKAQMALAMKLLPPNPGANEDTRAEAFELLIAASESGEPLAAVTAATLFMNTDPVRGYFYLLKFKQKHGEDPDVSRYIDRYPYIQRSIPAEELMRRVQLYTDD